MGTEVGRSRRADLPGRLLPVDRAQPERAHQVDQGRADRPAHHHRPRGRAHAAAEPDQVGQSRLRRRWQRRGRAPCGHQRQARPAELLHDVLHDRGGRRHDARELQRWRQQRHRRQPDAALRRRRGRHRWHQPLRRQGSRRRRHHRWHRHRGDRQRHGPDEPARQHGSTSSPGWCCSWRRASTRSAGGGPPRPVASAPTRREALCPPPPASAPRSCDVRTCARSSRRCTRTARRRVRS